MALAREVRGEWTAAGARADDDVLERLGLDVAEVLERIGIGAGAVALTVGAVGVFGGLFTGSATRGERHEQRAGYARAHHALANQHGTCHDCPRSFSSFAHPHPWRRD